MNQVMQLRSKSLVAPRAAGLNSQGGQITAGMRADYARARELLSMAAAFKPGTRTLAWK